MALEAGIGPPNLDWRPHRPIGADQRFIRAGKWRAACADLAPPAVEQRVAKTGRLRPGENDSALLAIRRLEQAGWT